MAADTADVTALAATATRLRIALTIASFGPDDFPDLARARELLPELDKLWDAVRHDLWTKIIAPQPRCRQWRWM
ncbi:hypothetical protein [Nocardia asiatica]|uniref:hypothetical protein n=1 Tax=Nocardia asiatica TaxID=209252 RepID=UPI0024547B6D|nr:hypothetical protein [Nocardia asiatica]